MKSTARLVLDSWAEETFSGKTCHKPASYLNHSSFLFASKSGILSCGMSEASGTQPLATVSVACLGDVMLWRGDDWSGVLRYAGLRWTCFTECKQYSENVSASGNETKQTKETAETGRRAASVNAALR